MKKISFTHNYQFLAIFLVAIGLSIVAQSRSTKRSTHLFSFIKKDIHTQVQPDSGLQYPIRDRRGNYQDENLDNSLDLNDPSNIQREINYNPQTQEFEVSENVGGKENIPYRNASSYSLEEYIRMQNQRAEDDYWKQKSSETVSFTGRKGIVPKLNIPGKAFDKIFGGSTVEIRPQGNIDIILGGNYQRIDNPALPEQNRRNGGFDFDMNINMNLVGNIGDKIKLNTNYNTLANFDFDNIMKLNYSGDEDQIIQKLEAGDVAMPLKSSLISGSQRLFGLKTALKFGRATITSVVSQHKTKAEEIRVQGGTQVQTFKVAIDEYEQNRHFFVSQYNRNTFDYALKTMPNIRTLFKITRVEAWVTNTNTATQNVRDVVAFADLGEPQPYNTTYQIAGKTLPDNNANNLYNLLNTEPSLNGVRQLDLALQRLQNSPVLTNVANPTFQGIQDFEITRARQLNATEFTFNPDLGFVSLNITLQPDEVLGVAFEYIYNGQKYQVGEFAQDYPVDPTRPNLLFLKMLKATSPRPNLPIWDLMMKNVYATGAYQVNQQDFKLDVVYQDPGGAFKRYIPSGEGVEGIPLIYLLNLDRLNNQNDAQRDGVFDFVPGVTILPQNGKIIFPVVEPFGTYLESKFTNPADAQQYIYQQLYDSTIVRAREFPEKNRFFIQGSYKSAVASEISLNAFNIPQGSIRVTAGGQQLREGIDYTVDYYLGKVKILNDGIMSSGLPIKVNFENSSLFGFQVKTMIGSRLDYYINDNISAGLTYMRLSERPFTQKINIGDDPILNQMFGADLSYNKEAPWLTRWLDKLPGLQTKAPSSITFSGEVAMLKPGHSKAVGKDGRAYIDDFEGTSSNYELKFPSQNWALSSTPVRFTENQLINNWDYGKNRAKLAWYIIDPGFRGTNENFAKIPANDITDIYTREFRENELFPNAQRAFGNNYLPTLDLAYYPEERGAYNFDTLDVNNNGTLRNPETRWGGITRALDINDFENANIEFIEFWLVDPFQNGNGGNGGKLYFNLGNISEDILKDSRKFFENGLPRDATQGNTDTSRWARVPNTQAITNSFDNDPNARTYQDVGFDGFDDNGERQQYSRYLSALQSRVSNIAYSDIQTDPAADNYHYYRGDDYDNVTLPILDRYKKYNGPQGNSPVTEQTNANYPTSATNNPDTEDLNRDNSLLQNEEYYEYEVDVFPGMGVGAPGSEFITDQVSINTPNGAVSVYQFRIPISKFDAKVGGIQDFRSIRFMRMYMTGFNAKTIMRFPKMQLVRNQWRRIERAPFDAIGSKFDVQSVNYEQNNNKSPVNYILPPGIEQEQSLGPNPDILQNEQALSFIVQNLADNQTRAVYKLLNMDMRRYKRLELFMHAESLEEFPLVQDNQVHAIVRIGSDFDENYYEYELPLKITPAGSYRNDNVNDKYRVWPNQNLIDFPLDSLRIVKAQRNASSNPINVPYSITGSKGDRYTIKGNPDLGYAKIFMIGVRNPATDAVTSINTEIWANELRLTNFDEKLSYAAIGRMDIRLADLGNVTVSASTASVGWGGIEQRIDQRAREAFLQYDATASLELGKFLPKKSGIKIPVYAGYSNNTKTPEWDPFDLDLKLSDKMKASDTKAERDSIKKAAQDITSIKTFNVTNLRKERVQREPVDGKPVKQRKPMPYDVENFSLSYSYTQTYNQNPTIESDLTDLHRGSLSYNYATQPFYIRPFDKVIKKKYLQIIKDINLNPVPSNLSFNTNINRQFNETKIRDIAEGQIPANYRIPATYNKYFTWDRTYGLKWDLTKSLTLDFNAINNARIDEPYGRIDNKEKRDTLMDNLKRFGRNTNYQHTANVNYTLPIEKLPLMDWTQIRARYGTTYNWTAARLQLDTLGNSIQNAQDISINGDLNFTKLYNKSKYLRKILEAKRPQPKGAKTDKNQPKKDDSKIDEKADGQQADTKGLTKEQKAALKKNKKKKERVPTDVERTFITPLLAIKKVSLTYSEKQNSLVPGFMPKHKYLGMTEQFNAPGWDYVFGIQPNTEWLNKAGGNGWITNNVYQNQQFAQNYTQSIEGRATLEPIRDFKVDVNLTKSYVRNHTEFYKVDTIGSPFQHLAPLDMGSYTISYMPINTMWDKYDPKQYITEIFPIFEENRHIISRRLGQLNPNSFELPTTDSVDTQHRYWSGYGRTSQDVLIPAFIAAYNRKDASKVNLNMFKQLPLPNWRLTYTGLSRIPAMRKLFNSFSLTHSYKSTFTVNRYITDLDYKSDSAFISRNRVGNYYSRYDIPTIVITEQFSPLIGVDINWKNNISTRFDYNKGRNLGLQFTDNQLVESRNEEITIGLGYRVKGLKSIFGKKKTPAKKTSTNTGNTSKTTPSKGGKKRRMPLRFSFENDINFKFDFSIRKDLTINHQFDQDYTEPTRGSKTIRISPSIDYTVNNQLNLRLFYDMNKTIPYTSLSFPITTTRFGLQIRFTLQ